MAQLIYKAVVSFVMAVGIVAGSASTTMPAEEQPRNKVEVIEIKSPQTLIKEIWGKDSEAGLYYGDCESDFRNIQSLVLDRFGERENSWGIYQINLDAHPEILKEQALDISFNIAWAYEQYKKGLAKKEWRKCHDFLSGK